MMTLPLNPQDAANIPASPSADEVCGCSPQMIENIQRSLYEQRLASELRRVRGSEEGLRWHATITILCGFTAFLAIDLLLLPETVSLAVHVFVAAGAAFAIAIATWLISTACERRAKPREDAAHPAASAPDLIEDPTALGGGSL